MADLAVLGEQFGLDLTGPTPDDPLAPYYDLSGLKGHTAKKKSSQTPQLGEDGQELEDIAEEPEEEVIEEEPEEEVVDEGPVEEVIEDLPEV